MVLGTPTKHTTKSKESFLELHTHFLPFTFSMFSSTSHSANKEAFCIFGIVFFCIIRISLGQGYSLLPQGTCLNIKEWVCCKPFSRGNSNFEIIAGFGTIP